MFGDIYRNRTVLVTGHTGFKGSWLSLWLTQLGAKVVGYSLPAPTNPSHFALLKMEVTSIAGSVCDRDHLQQVIQTYRPGAVFHLAAQPLVRWSYRNPLETFATNVQGTINLYEACRVSPDIRAIVTVTSDKAYDNGDTGRAYRESDPVGGRDPYSCSKGCAELITACYQQSFFNPHLYGTTHRTLLASARAGNVIGGGDWAEDRLVPDAVKATTRDEPTVLRNPDAVRPWQHVMEPLAGYLALGQCLLEGKPAFSGPWNFGPDDSGHVNVATVIRKLQGAWPRVRFQVAANQNGPHEARVLKLDSSKARSRLNWRPVWDWAETVERTGAWYRAFYEDGAVTSRDELRQYVTDAHRVGCGWID